MITVFATLWEYWQLVLTSSTNQTYRMRRLFLSVVIVSVLLKICLYVSSHICPSHLSFLAPSGFILHSHIRTSSIKVEEDLARTSDSLTHLIHCRIASFLFLAFIFLFRLFIFHFWLSNSQSDCLISIFGLLSIRSLKLLFFLNGYYL